MKSGRKLQDQLDSIKSLASLTNTVHILVGTYELLPFRNLSAQLSRRSIDIHFPRYCARKMRIYAAFRNVVFTFQRHLPLTGETDLLPHLEYCYERSVWLCRVNERLADAGFGLGHKSRRRRREPQDSGKNGLVAGSVRENSRETVDGGGETPKKKRSAIA